MHEGFSEARLEIDFDVDQPVELVTLTLALQSLGRDYRRFVNDSVRESGGKIADEDVKLYVTKVKSGSIHAELAGAVQVVGAFFSVMDYQSVFANYVTNFGTMAQYFISLLKREDLKASDIECTKAGAQAVADIMAVVAANRDGNLRLAAVRGGSESATGDKVYVEVSFTSEEAAQAQRGALLAQKVLDYRGDADFQNVLLYFQRTSTDAPKADGRTDDKAIINTISEKALPVHFASQLDAARVNDMKADPRQNPFKAAFRVDVNVETDRNQVPRFYRVVHIHQVIPDDENDDAS
jgi:hypothetical protein